MMPTDAQTLLEKAQACLLRSELAAGLAAAEQARAAAPDDETRGRADWLRVQFVYRGGDYAGVLALTESVEPTLRRLGGDSFREYRRCVVLTACELGRFDVALPAAYEVHALAEASGLPGPRAQALNAFGACFERMGDPWQAERLQREALAIAREGATPRDLFATLNNLCAVLIGAYYLQRGEAVTPEAQAALERALPLAREAIPLLDQVGEPYARAIAEGNLGEVLVHLGEREQSRRLLEDALADTVRLGFRPQRQRLGCSLAEWELRHGDPARARVQLEALLAEAAEQALMPMTAVRAHHALYQACKTLGDTSTALQHLEMHAELVRQRIVQQLRAQSEQFITRVEAEQSRREADRQRERAREMEARAQRDPLTGLGNRREVDARLPTLLHTAAAAGQPVALAMLDLDRFKQINDRFGHLVGDAVLVAVARLLRDSVRAGDLLARTGGEEFLAVLPDADPGRAQKVFERVRTCVEAHDWQALAPGLQVTVSIGLAQSPPHPGSALMARADAALYRAKEGGRNRVETG
jgi:diguanylate cyclase (GGDEF)-like protein